MRIHNYCSGAFPVTTNSYAPNMSEVFNVLQGSLCKRKSSIQQHVFLKHSIHLLIGPRIVFDIQKSQNFEKSKGELLGDNDDMNCTKQGVASQVVKTHTKYDLEIQT